MATFPLSFVLRSHCLSCGDIRSSSKSVAAARCNYLRRVTGGFGKMDGERSLVCGDDAKESTSGSHQNNRLRVLATSRFSVVQSAKKVLSYRFLTEVGGHVKVLIERKNNKYGVNVDVSSLQLLGHKGELVMVWGIFRSDSSCYMPLDFLSSSVDRKSKTTDTPLRGPAVELDFEANLAPFYVSFWLKYRSSGGSQSLEVRTHRKTNFCVPVGFSSGYPAPLGLSFPADGSMNFALFSRSAESVVLCLYDDTMKPKPALEIELDPYVNRSGDIWHASIDSDIPFMSYGYRCKGGGQEKGDKHVVDKILLDPYAKVIGDFSGLGQLCKEPAFDWAGDPRPCLPIEKLVVYRLNVMRFTKDRSSNLPNDISGTFSGIAKKFKHLKDLGVNAILLEPILPFDEQKGPYFPYHFFSPMKLYGPSGNPMSAFKSMKEMVQRLHASGIEIFLEVVFTHTAEGGALNEIDDSSYYHVKESEVLGTRYALNCNYPIVQHMILDSLRHWVIEFHIDGFCFINASSLLRGFHGENLSRPPLVEAVAFDPILSKCKIIADYWDPHGTVSEDIRFPHWKRWAEVNTNFCTDVRNFLRGEGLLSNLATRLCGSGDKFLDGRGPAFSFNFIARNSGLSLVDLVSFSSSELASELSWNCGEEGATNKPTVLGRRLKQIRNFLFILFVSLGVPVLNMGDECGQSSGGSASYSDRRPFDWNALRTGFGIQTTEFISFLSSLRKRHSDLLQNRNFLKEENIEWHGSEQSAPSWEDPSSKFLAMTLKAEMEGSQSNSESSCLSGNLFVAFNAADKSESVILPSLPPEMAWLRLVDTALLYPGFFSMDGDPVLEQMPGLVIYEMKSHSCVLFEARNASVFPPAPNTPHHHPTPAPKE
ncbi:hypothetical protein RJ639_043091 [Escallonia herrerae]|uniref:Glycosyl hydrolase family 13 catalytic domain-containing protein n=1 Tax=Escallonia herrerae TaxID=1293975 RepID=A0AA88W8N5_9ASTE|nr:hypothetical protein RJ639_043091 [Escallonia herrerae]